MIEDAWDCNLSCMKGVDMARLCVVAVQLLSILMSKTSKEEDGRDPCAGVRKI